MEKKQQENKVFSVERNKEFLLGFFNTKFGRATMIVGGTFAVIYIGSKILRFSGNIIGDYKHFRNSLNS